MLVVGCTIATGCTRSDPEIQFERYRVAANDRAPEIPYVTRSTAPLGDIELEREDGVVRIGLEGEGWRDAVGAHTVGAFQPRRSVVGERRESKLGWADRWREKRRLKHERTGDSPEKAAQRHTPEPDVVDTMLHLGGVERSSRFPREGR